MIYVVIGIAIVIAIVSMVKEEGNFWSKFALAALVAAIAFLLLQWITDWELMLTLAKVCAAGTVLSLLINIILKIVK